MARLTGPDVSCQPLTFGPQLSPNGETRTVLSGAVGQHGGSNALTCPSRKITQSRICTAAKAEAERVGGGAYVLCEALIGLLQTLIALLAFPLKVETVQG